MNIPTEWKYRPKSYLHFDVRPSGAEGVAAYVSDPLSVERHAHWPFIRFLDRTKRYKPSDGKTKAKIRPLAYAAHMDGAIFSYYSHLLAAPYEDALRRAKIADCVLAYRSGTGSAYVQAIDVFHSVVALRPCVALAFDIEKFFDSLDHARLKRAWASLLGASTLPPDHYAVFRAITRYSWVDLADVRGFVGSNAGWRPRICSPAEFRTSFRNTGKVHKHPHAFGIPQGSSISATLSNIYLFDVDVRLNAFARARGGIYRRYADDILLVVPPGDEAAARREVTDAVSAAGLSLQTSKTEVRQFSSATPIQPPLQYLGLTFDGATVRIRPSSVSRFYRKMKRGVRAKAAAAQSAGGPLWTRALRTLYSHVGGRNFYAYARRVALASGCSAATDQLRRHSSILEQLIRDAQATLPACRP